MEENYYLVFIEDVGMNLDEKNVYQFYFSDRPEVVWGDYWNICPVSIVPAIKPDINSISKIYEVEMDYNLNLVTENSCFSMQDCIDQIIALGWFDLNQDILQENIAFKFGETFDKIKKIFSELRIEFDESKLIYDKQDESEEMIDNLIEKLGGDSDGLEW